MGRAEMVKSRRFNHERLNENDRLLGDKENEKMKFVRSQLQLPSYNKTFYKMAHFFN